MFFKLFFCCSNSTLKENEVITFDKINVNEPNNIKEDIPSPIINMDYSKKNDSKENLKNSEIKRKGFINPKY